MTEEITASSCANLDQISEWALHSTGELENCDSPLFTYDMMPMYDMWCANIYRLCAGIDHVWIPLLVMFFFIHLYSSYQDESANFLTIKWNDCENDSLQKRPKTNWEYICEEIISLSPSLLSFGALVTWITLLISLTLSFSLCSSFSHVLCFSSFHRICDEFHKKLLTFAFICHFVLTLLRISRHQTVEFHQM